MDVELSTPSIDEYERILELWEEAGLPYKPEGRDTRANIERELKEQPEYWIGAYDDGKLIGIVFGTDDGRKGWINRLAVTEDYRGRGIGKTLVEELEKVFEKKGFKIWAALIEPDNPDAMDFFEHLDFEDKNIKYYSKRESDKV
ncbi:MAG: GNAT family N-acetyltransferase [Candidatus Thermoplasmatota archaeon]